MSVKANKPNPLQGASSPHYSLGSWQGMPQWKCNYCPWDTLDGEGEMLAHVAERHLPAPPLPQPGIIPVYDRYGNLVAPSGGE